MSTSPPYVLKKVQLERRTLLAVAPRPQPRMHAGAYGVQLHPRLLQEKNRQAQARFRERQKAKQSETERRMADLEKAVLRLQVCVTMVIVTFEVVRMTAIGTT